jgi:lipoprotein-anchoring transpeptidase ErfK/SrfK
MPSFLVDGGAVIRFDGSLQNTFNLSPARAIPKSGFAIIERFDVSGRAFGLTADLQLLPLDRLAKIEPSRFHGIALSDEVTLPVAFIRSNHAQLYAGHPSKSGLTRQRALEFREAVPLSGHSVSAHGKRYYETTEGHWIIDERLVKVDRFQERPSWARPGRTWIDVSILNQTLVAYEGDTPVYATLVSTGIDGIGDPAETHSTIQGQFLVHTKHVTVTMSGDEVGDEFDLRDVPYVQYFHEGYALHGVYWHDGFGLPRSHGCVNLSPLDARWLFEWTDPTVPQGWHGGMSLRDGTFVYIHP